MAKNVDNFQTADEHNAVDHTGLTGVPAPEAFTSAVHDAVDHTGFTGVNSFDSTAHDAVNHAGLTGVDGQTAGTTGPQATSDDITYLIPGNTLAVDNESLEFTIWGRNTSGGSGDTITVTFGATTILSLTVHSSFDEFVIRGTIFRTGAATQVIIASGLAEQTSAQVVTRTAASETLSGALALTAADTSNNIAFDALVIRKWSA